MIRPHGRLTFFHTFSDVSEKLLTVHFHVFVSEDFDFDPERQKVLLIIGNEELGGWNEKSRLLSIKR